jgi:hypothetical protein
MAGAPQWIIAVALIGSFVFGWLAFYRKRRTEYDRVIGEVRSRTPLKRLLYIRLSFWGLLLVVAAYVAGRLFDVFWIGQGATAAMAAGDLSYSLTDQWERLALAPTFPRATKFMVLGAMALVVSLLWSVLGKVEALRMVLRGLFVSVLYLGLLAGAIAAVAAIISWLGGDPPNHLAMAAFYSAWAFAWVVLATSSAKLDSNGDELTHAMLPGYGTRPLFG